MATTTAARTADMNTNDIATPLLHTTAAAHTASTTNNIATPLLPTTAAAHTANMNTNNITTPLPNTTAAAHTTSTTNNIATPLLHTTATACLAATNHIATPLLHTTATARPGATNNIAAAHTTDTNHIATPLLNTTAAARTADTNNIVTPLLNTTFQDNVPPMLITISPSRTSTAAQPHIRNSTNTPTTITLQRRLDSEDSNIPQNDRFAGLEVVVETPRGNKSDAVALVKQYIYGLTCCFDTGWQWCASGHNYNSMSGHAFLVGANSNKILVQVCYSKSCCSCRREIAKKKKNGEAVTNEKVVFGEKPTDDKKHHCPHNFEEHTILMVLQNQWRPLVRLSASPLSTPRTKLNASIL